MNVKLLVGIVLFVIGLVTAVMGIAGVSSPATRNTDSAIVTQDDEQQGVTDRSSYLALPFVSGLSLAVGGLLIGLSAGNWKHPRTNLKPGDEAVNPEGYHKMKHV